MVVQGRCFRTEGFTVAHRMCYYYGRGVVRDVAQANVWFRKAAAQGNEAAARALQEGIPGDGVREMIARFTNVGTAPPRYAAAHEFAELVDEHYMGPR
jgi:TPR repeat protein